MKTHELKTDPEYFEDILSGRKTAELRYDNRNFRVGDELKLRETQFRGHEMGNQGAPLIYTGRELVFNITHVLKGHPGLAKDYVMLSIEKWKDYVSSV